MESFNQYDVYSLELLKFLCSFCGDYSYVFIDNNEILGYIITCKDDDSAHIISIAVKRKARRRGIGSALLCTALRLLERGEVKKVYLEVRVSNSDAIRLYEKAGFKIVETLEGYYGDGEAGYRMEITDRKIAKEFCKNYK